MCCCCCKGCAKILLLIFNITYLLSGLLMLALGITALVNPDYLLSLLQLQMPSVSTLSAAVDIDKVMTYSGIFLIVFGIVVMIVAALGCYGALSQQKTILIAYIAVVGVFILAEVALIIFAIVAPKKFKEPIRNTMYDSLNVYTEDVTLFTNDTMLMPTDTVSLAWTFLQFEMGCCGTFNYSDYKNRGRSATINGVSRSAAVPISCCLKTTDIKMQTSTIYDKPSFSNLDSCLDGTKTNVINSESCFEEVYDLIKKLRNIGVGNLCGFVGKQVWLIILAAMLHRQNKKEEVV